MRLGENRDRFGHIRIAGLLFAGRVHTKASKRTQILHSPRVRAHPQLCMLVDRGRTSVIAWADPLLVGVALRREKVPQRIVRFAATRTGFGCCLSPSTPLPAAPG